MFVQNHQTRAFLNNSESVRHGTIDKLSLRANAKQSASILNKFLFKFKCFTQKNADCFVEKASSQ